MACLHAMTTPTRDVLIHKGWGAGGGLRDLIPSDFWKPQGPRNVPPPRGGGGYVWTPHPPTRLARRQRYPPAGTRGFGQQLRLINHQLLWFWGARWGHAPQKCAELKQGRGQGCAVFARRHNTSACAPPCCPVLHSPTVLARKTAGPQVSKAANVLHVLDRGGRASPGAICFNHWTPTSFSNGEAQLIVHKCTSKTEAIAPSGCQCILLFLNLCRHSRIIFSVTQHQ